MKKVKSAAITAAILGLGTFLGTLALWFKDATLMVILVLLCCCLVYAVFSMVHNYLTYGDVSGHPDKSYSESFWSSL
jgi:hypothetical protein